MKKVLLILMDDTLLEEYIEIATSFGDCIDVVMVNNLMKGKLKNKTESISDAIKNKKYDYIFSYDEKIVNKVADIAENVGAKTYNIKSEAVRDKVELKKILTENQILCPEAYDFDNVDELEEYKDKIKFPVIIKPSNSYASNGVRKVSNWIELKEQARNIKKINIFQKKVNNDKLGKILVEQYISGEEYAVEMIWQAGKPVLRGITLRLHDKDNVFFPDYVYYIEPNMDEKERKTLYNICDKIGKVMGIRNGATHTELRKEGRNYYVLESAFRPGGSGMLYKLFKEEQKIDFLKAYYEVMTGRKIEDKKEVKNNCFHLLYSYPKARSGIIKDVVFNEKKLDSKISIIHIQKFVGYGDKIMSIQQIQKYIIFILATVDSREKSDLIEAVQDLENNCCIEYMD